MKRNIIFIIVIIMVSVAILGTIQNYNNKLYTAYNSLRSTSIELNLVKLQWTIELQEENNWSNPFAVTEKMNDVLEGIYMTMVLGKDLKIMKKKKEDALLLLAKVFSEYDKSGDSPDGVKEFNTSDQQAFNKLGSDLKKVGWGMGENLSENDDEFKEAVYKLYNYQLQK